MATHSPNTMNWWLEIDREHGDYLRPIRHWSHLSMAAGPGVFWVKGLQPKDVESAAVRSIPFRRLLYQRDDLLYPAGGLVSLKRIADNLNWMPLEKGLPLRLPSFNHNYFGMSERVTMRLIPASKEEPAAAALIAMEHLRSFAERASSSRLRQLGWLVFEGRPLVVGNPLLPLPGDIYWLQGDHLLPLGFDFEFPALAGAVSEQDCLLLWDTEGRSVPLDKRSFRPLSLSSIRST
jgi:hypothetical protein